MKIRNFTPHPITFMFQTGMETTFQSEGSIRIETSTEVAEIDDGIVLLKTVTNKESTILPKEEENTLFIVSSLVRTSFPERKDFISPSGNPKFVIRDEKGFVKAVTGFDTNL